ncbi:TonB-dependent receptor [soil metagenome]
MTVSRQTHGSRGRAYRVGGTLTAVALAILSSAASARAANVRPLSLNIPSQRVSEALLDLALHARISVGGDITACRGISPAIVGSRSLDQALTRILAGSGCSYAIHQDGAVIIHRDVAAPPARRPWFRRRSSPPVVTTAPPAPPSEATALSDVVVTASRRPESPQRAPMAISAVTGGQIVANGVTDTNDLSGLVAGMTVTNLGLGRNKVLLRGMSDGAFTGLTQSTVALYLDLIPITYSAPDPDLKMIDIDRVEVLRGPQGTLYGTGPIGGVVRLITRSPDLDDVYLDLSATNSKTRSGGLNTDYSGTINLPVIDGIAAVRLSAYKETFGGYVDDVNLNIRSINDGIRQGGRAAATVRLTEGWRVTAGVVNQSIETEDTHYVYRILGGLRRANLVREPHVNKFDETYLTVDGEGSWGRLDASVGYVRHRFDSRYDATAALSAFGSNPNRLGALDERKQIRLWVGEFAFTSPDEGPFRWLIGGLASTSSTHADTTLTALLPRPSTIYGEIRDDDLTELAIFGETAWDLTPDLTLIAGARTYTFDYGTVSDVSQGLFQRPFEARGSSTGVSPKLGLDYRYSDQIDLYVQVSQGHRTGGFNTAGPAAQKFTGTIGVPSRDYRPDTLWNYEIGAKGVFWHDQLQARVSAFVARWSDIQSDQFLPSGLAYAVNVGNGANQGVELEANWRPTADLIVRANALIADPRITRPSASFNSRGDAGLPGVPNTSANVTVAWRRPIWRDVSAAVDANLAYVGASRLTFDAARRYRMGDYVTARLAAGLEGDHWAATAFVDNPFDTEANTFSFGDPFRLPEALASTPLRPRTFGLTLRWMPFG